MSTIYDAGPYRTLGRVFAQSSCACAGCRYALDPMAYDDFYCIYDDYPDHCHGPYVGPEPVRLSLWERLKKLFHRSARMEIRIKGLSFEEWEKQANSLRMDLGIRKQLIQPFDYWQGNYSPVLAVLDMFPELNAEQVSNELMLREAGL